VKESWEEVVAEESPKKAEEPSKVEKAAEPPAKVFTGPYRLFLLFLLNFYLLCISLAFRHEGGLWRRRGTRGR
jgi:hypothetical protein